MVCADEIVAMLNILLVRAVHEQYDVEVMMMMQMQVKGIVVLECLATNLAMMLANLICCCVMAKAQLLQHNCHSMQDSDKYYMDNNYCMDMVVMKMLAYVTNDLTHCYDYC